MKFPYGVSDFHKIITGGYVYVDRTAHIRTIEEAGSQLLFLRPRRFGKSLWLSTLENYYDVARADEFETLFGHLTIGQDPTPRHNQYFVLKWDFSAVAPRGGTEDIRQALHNHINSQIQFFANTYRDWLEGPIEIDRNDAIYSFQMLLAALQRAPYPLYLLIDEYDNFANEIMMGPEEVGQERYKTLLYGEGALKTVFKAVKSAASGRGLDRVFITGVAPVVLSDLTSGYNVAKTIALMPELNALCGFTEEEIAETLRAIAATGAIAEDQTAAALEMMRTFYNGYRFSYDAKTVVYNPTLAVYFLKHLAQYGEYPREVLDVNLAMDRNKLAYIAQLPNGAQLLLDVLQSTEPLSLVRLARRFGVEDVQHAVKDTTFMLSLLYYFGILTLAGYTRMGKLKLQVPNLVARKLYVEQLQDTLLPAVRQDTVAQLAETFYTSGDLAPVCEFVEQRYFKVFDNRDYRWANELTVKTAFLTLLFNDTFYIMDSEPALERAYADLVMIVRPDMRQYALLDFLIEFKYVKLSDVGLSSVEARELSVTDIKALPPVQEKLAEARAQLRDYRGTLETVYGEKLRLRTYAVVALGFDRLLEEGVHEL